LARTKLTNGCTGQISAVTFCAKTRTKVAIKNLLGEPGVMQWNSMNRLVFAILLSFVSIGAISAPRFSADYSYGKELELSISPSFSDSVVFTVVSAEDGVYLVRRIFAHGDLRWDDVKSEAHIKLSEPEYAKVMSLLDGALSFDLKDGIALEDGSLWQLETTRYQWMKIRISTPEYETESRGYEGLIALSKYLRLKFE
jgi:hypothetical protein